MKKSETQFPPFDTKVYTNKISSVFVICEANIHVKKMLVKN